MKASSCTKDWLVVCNTWVCFLMGGKATHSSVAVGVLWHESDS